MIWFLLAIALLVLTGLPWKIDDTHCHMQSHKIHGKLRIAVISDLHCREFGKGQKKIMRIIKSEKPDLVLIPGDLFDVDRNCEISFELIGALRGYTVCFTSGNHDMYLSEDIEKLRSRLKEEGVHVLEDGSEVFSLGNSTVEIAGMSDHGRKPAFTSEEVSAWYHTDQFRILISHRPDYLDFYRKVDVDLIVCGHDHGGQWRIPFTHQGLIAPNQGLFPKYTEGMHDLGERKIVISRGLASGAPYIPRLYNNPEVVIIDVEGKE